MPPAPPENPKRNQSAPAKPPTLSEDQISRQDVFSLSAGPVVLSWPAALSKDSFEDLSAWLEIVKRKIGRSVKAVEPGHSA